MEAEAMNSLSVGICGLGLLTLAGVAQTGSGSNVAQDLRLAPNTKVHAKLMTPLSAAKAKPGDAVTAEIMEDLKVNGRVLIPRKARLNGHVTEAQSLSKMRRVVRLGF